MAVFRQVHVSFWQDARVVEEMTPEDRYFYLYLLTNPNTTQIGIYPITKKQMAFDLGYSIESVNALVDRFQNHHELIIYNQETREIAILNWGKYNFNRGGKPVEDCVKKELSQVKDKSLIGLIAQKIENKSIKALFEKALNDTCNDTSTIRGQEEEKEEEEEKEKEKEKNKSPKKSPKRKKENQRKRENLCSIEDIQSFVESQMAFNPLSVNQKLLVKYIDCLRLYRKTARVSTNIIKNLWEKWKNYHPDVVSYAMWLHAEKHDDKPEEYTLAIMRKTDEHKARRGLMILKNKASEQKGELFNVNAQTSNGDDIDYDQFVIHC